MTVVQTLTEKPPILGNELSEGNEANQNGIGEMETVPALYKVIKIVDGDTVDVLTDDKETFGYASKKRRVKKLNRHQSSLTIRF